MKMRAWATLFLAGMLMTSVGVGAGVGAMAAKGTGTIEVTVIDSEGAVVPGVTVTLQQSALRLDGPGSNQIPMPGGGRTAARALAPYNDLEERATDKEGKVTFKELEPHRYRMVVFESPFGQGYVAVTLGDGKTEKKTLRVTKG
jgi:hypothetical protein